MTSVREIEESLVAAARACVYAEVDDWRLRPPQPVARYVQRDRLVDPLTGPGQARVVVVSAPAAG
jgi:hypothetical protein